MSEYGPLNTDVSNVLGDAVGSLTRRDRPEIRDELLIRCDLRALCIMKETLEDQTAELSKLHVARTVDLAQVTTELAKMKMALADEKLAKAEALTDAETVKGEDRKAAMELWTLRNSELFKVHEEMIEATDERCKSIEFDEGWNAAMAATDRIIASKLK